MGGGGVSHPGQSLDHFRQRQLLALKWDSIPESCQKMEGLEAHSVLSGIPRQVVIRAHQEQLDEMAELGFRRRT